MLVIAVAAVSILVFFLLALWTRALTAEEETERLRSALESVLETEGEKGLLMMAGVPVDAISYGDDRIPLFSGDRPSWELTGEEQRGIAIYERTRGSVVRIASASELSGSGQGAGVIISPDGYIVTNRHVASPGTEFLISLYDGRVLEASLVGSDALSDIAVLSVAVRSRERG